MRTLLIAGLGLVMGAVSASARQPFVNWETAHVHPLDITPDRSRLLAVNTPDNRLEVFTLNASGDPVWTGSIPVGLDPISVRVRSNSEAWVVNSISDSISIVNLTTLNVVRTLRTRDEPADVVFAGTAGDAFVSCAQESIIQVFAVANLAALPMEIPIGGEDPRALAISPDGNTVYVCVFESGNVSTILNGQHSFGMNPVAIISGIGTPYNGKSPPPNDGAFGYIPPAAPGNPFPPEVGVIVKRNASGAWVDDNGANWANWVSGSQAFRSNRPTGWTLPDRDVVMINANTRAVTGAATRLLNMVMAIGVNPASGRVSVVGTDAINEVRFEANLRSKFVRVNVGLFDPANPSGTRIVKDLNTHLTYASSTIPLAQRQKSVGDPRAIAWNSAGTIGYIVGMGSNNLIAIDATGTRLVIPGTSTDTVPVGEGPTGLVLDEARGLLYALNKFASSISVIPTATLVARPAVPMYDPTPAAIKVGRKHLYNTINTSGLGQASCASCHVDARMDRLTWDLGTPEQPISSDAINDQNLGANRPDIGFSAVAGTELAFQDWHPMKGPFLTQTLQGIIGDEPFHWRGDRDGIEAFNPAFISLLGDDAVLTPAEMQQFKDFIATITFPPNPFRNFDNTLKTSLPLPGHYTFGRFGSTGVQFPNGNAIRGVDLFRNGQLSLGRSCGECHALPIGSGTDYRWQNSQWQPFPVGPFGEHHHMLSSIDGATNRVFKVPQLRNLYKRTGTNFTQVENTAGFGFFPDGSVDALAKFAGTSPVQVQSDQDIADITAFLLSLSGSDLPAGIINDLDHPLGSPSADTRASVGWQTTINGTLPAEQVTLTNAMLAEANLLRVGLIAKGRVGGVQRGFMYVGTSAGGADAGFFLSDRTIEKLTPAQLNATTFVDGEITWTVVPLGSERRIGIDRDLDTYLDRDELDAGSNPADPASVPPVGCVADANGDNLVNGADLSVLLSQFGQGVAIGTGADLNNDGIVDAADLSVLLARFGLPC